ncbi:hypothetical protein ACH5RR_031837 [Cinchona calisaya]|uniref:Uncharacterized protein n=1 Tax=Cinchona calisaya TaxID=153742 RepID=A0ABD2YKM0_9GENT
MAAAAACASASSLGLIDSALVELRNQCNKCFREDLDRPSEPNFEWLSFSDNIEALSRDWLLLKTFWESIYVWSDAGKVFLKEKSEQNREPQSLALKIDAAAKEVAADLISIRVYGEHEEEYSVSEMNNLLADCMRKSEQLMAEVGEAVDHLTVSSIQVQVKLHSLADHRTFWTTFLSLVRRNLRLSLLWYDRSIDPPIPTNSLDKQILALDNEISSFKKYITAIQKEFGSNFPVAAASDHVIDDFLKHVASVFVRIAIESCSCWSNSNKKSTDRIEVVKSKLTNKQLVDLHYEIDPTNPKFMEFHLKFLKAIKKMKIKVVDFLFCQRQVDFVGYFCSYLLTQRTHIALERELKSLVSIFISQQLEDDDSGLFQEISLLLVEAACLWEPVRKLGETRWPPCSELLTKVCLLKAELFLKGQLYNSNSFSVIFNRYHYGGFHNILENLRRFSKDIPQEKMEYGKQRLELIEKVAKEVAFLCEQFEAKKITESMAKNSLLQLLLKMVVFKSKSFFMELLNSNAISIAYEKDQIVSLLEQLKFLDLLLPNKQSKDREDVDMIFPQIEALARWMMCFSCSCTIKRQSIISVSELQDKVKHIKPKLKEIGPQFPLSNFPKTCIQGFIDFLCRKLGELLKYDPKSIAPVKHHVVEIRLNLKSLSSFLVKVSVLNIEHQELKDLGNHLINLAYKIEYVVDSIQVDAHWQHFFWFGYLIEELRLVDRQASQIHEIISDAKVQNVTLVSCDMKSQGRTPVIHEMVVNLWDEEEVIIDRLTRGSSHRDIVSIVGMPGLGKTTMARKVYNNKKIVYHFHHHAWCTVSQVYDKKELLLEILSDIHGPTSEIHQMSQEDLELKLHQCLLKNRYLIVMDDVWDVGAWNDLDKSFPDDVNGSRILITSRIRDVTMEIKPNADPHSLRPFSDDESWKLLEEKVFQGEGSPEEFLLVGQKIAQQCKGPTSCSCCNIWSPP